ncbi:HET-domain-containing protein, partial [Polyplosphaeria fusca]
MIKKWLSTCQDCHTKCHLFGRQTTSGVPTKSSRDIGGLPNRPTRVLDVSHGKVRLKCNTSIDTNFDYFTLSHMWGPDPTKQLRLELDTFERFQEEVPWHELSDIFKEAVCITRLLGYDYIWIDSLCIIQDSTADWNKEAARMATVYGNSSCNLAFVCPPQESICKHRDDPRGYAPCVLRPKARSLRGVYLSLAVSETTVDWLEPKKWPLFNRAWVFQERILSPRNLYYGNEAMVWECCELFCDELVGTAPTALEAYTHGTEILSKYYLHSTIMKFMEVWTGAVNEYRHMQLTKAKDRVIAFAGIAQAIQNLSGFVYLAGLWRESLPLGLLWGFKQSGTIRESGVETAPSWSWFS